MRVVEIEVLEFSLMQLGDRLHWENNRARKYR
jgi:hypothetical protein